MKLFVPKLCVTIFIVIYYTHADNDVNTAPTDKKEKKELVRTYKWQEITEGK